MEGEVRAKGWQMMNVSLSLEVRHDCWFSYSSSRVRGSDAVASWMSWGY